MRRLQVTTTANELRAKIIFEAQEVIDDILRKNASAISRKCGIIISRRLTDSKTFASLLYGQLKLDFGLTNEEADKGTKLILASVRDSTKVKLIKTKQGNAFAISINITPNLPELSQISYTNDGKNGGEITWLMWLLTKGVEIVVPDFRIKYGDSKKFENSRSGGALMFPKGFFRVDPDFAGTVDSNFITDVIQESFPEIVGIIRTYL
jgi:hypothetical protein